ncbi:hypothetical protein FD737_06695 [Pantoea sp. Seng]|uniref:hypothetical protein n=1 Tax=Pantoea sp. Seng TaxID=2576761 RepID=UPI001326F703|nr:hypothetical protein [Pantoea sp. Seng]MXP52769.1 hypothetical protein [Pantoea sp. Seng]
MKVLKILLISILFLSNSVFSNESLINIHIKDQGNICYHNSENRIMQSFHINDHEKNIWYAFDTKSRDRQIIEVVKDGGLISRHDYINKNSIGHLDGFFVMNDTILTTNKYNNPAIIIIKNGIILKRIPYPITIYGNQILAINRNDISSFLLWASDDKLMKNIFIGRFSPDLNSILSLKKTTISFPQNEVIQGISYNGKFLFALTGVPNKNAKLYKWNVKNGGLTYVKNIIFDPEWLDQGYFEPEGLELTGNSENETLRIGFSTKQLLENKAQFINCISSLSKDHF